MTGDPTIIDAAGRQDRQDPAILDFDLSILRSNVAFDFPLSTVLAGDPLAYDGPTTPSTTLFTGYLFVRVQRVAADPVRIEAGGNFKMPPTTRIFVSNPAQAGKMIRLYCLPRAYDLKFYLRFDTPFVGGAAASGVTVTVANTLITPALAGRQSVMIQNANAIGGQPVFISPTSPAAVTSLQLSPLQVMVFDRSTTGWWGITAAGTADVRVIVEG